MLLRRPVGKKHFQQLFIQANEILADNLQRRLVAFRGHQQRIIKFANPLPQVHLQLPVTVGLLFGIRVLLLQSLDCVANIVSVFFQRYAHGAKVAGFSSAARFIHLRVPQLLN